MKHHKTNSNDYRCLPHQPRHIPNLHRIPKCLWLHRLTTMEDPRYPKDAIKIVSNIYTNSTTAFHGSHFRSMPLIPINRGTTQGDTQCPNLFHIFLDSLLRWLEKRRHCKLPNSTTNILTHLLHKGFCISNASLLPDYTYWAMTNPSFKQPMTTRHHLSRIGQTYMHQNMENLIVFPNSNTKHVHDHPLLTPCSYLKENTKHT